MLSHRQLCIKPCSGCDSISSLLREGITCCMEFFVFFTLGYCWTHPRNWSGEDGEGEEKWRRWKDGEGGRPSSTEKSAKFIHCRTGIRKRLYFVFYCEGCVHALRGYCHEHLWSEPISVRLLQVGCSRLMVEMEFRIRLWSVLEVVRWQYRWSSSFFQPPTISLFRSLGIIMMTLSLKKSREGLTLFSFTQSSLKNGLDSRHGFNKSTTSLFFKDYLKQLAISYAISLPMYSIMLILLRVGLIFF